MQEPRSHSNGSPSHTRESYSWCNCRLLEPTYAEQNPLPIVFMFSSQAYMDKITLRPVSEVGKVSESYKEKWSIPLLLCLDPECPSGWKKKTLGIFWESLSCDTSWTKTASKPVVDLRKQWVHRVSSLSRIISIFQMLALCSLLLTNLAHKHMTICFFVME